MRNLCCLRSEITTYWIVKCRCIFKCALCSVKHLPEMLTPRPAQCHSQPPRGALLPAASVRRSPPWCAPAVGSETHRETVCKLCRFLNVTKHGDADL